MSKDISHCPVRVFPSIFVLLNSTPKHVYTGLTSLILTPRKASLTVYPEHQLYAEDVVSMCLTQRIQILEHLVSTEQARQV